MAEPLACPILSLMKTKPQACLGSACAWWVEKVNASGREYDPGCALRVHGDFFQERRFTPSK